MQQGDLFGSPLEQGIAAAQACADAAEAKGWCPESAAAFLLDWLTRHGPTPGETLVSQASAAGHRPHDARAFGAILARLKREGRIEVCGFTRRQKGHGTSGGNVWRLVCNG